MKYLLLLLLLTSCNLAPKYARPSTVMPVDFRQEASTLDTIANVNWWENLSDPILNQLIQTALVNNKDLQVAIWRVCSYYAEYEVARSKLFPEINLEGLALKERLSPSGNFLPSGFSPINPVFDYNFNLSYEIDLWGKIRNSSFAAYSSYLAEVENRRTVVLTLVANVGASYILLRQLDLELEIARKTLKERKDALQIAIDRFQGGLTSELEVAQARSTYDETLATLEDYERKVPQAENLLSVLLGENPQSIVRGKTINEFTLPQNLAAGLPSDLILNRPDIRAAENKLIAANANIGVARAAFLPTINLSGLYGNESLGLGNLFKSATRTWAIGGNFVENLFTGGRLMGNLRLSLAQKQALIYAYEQTILTALREVNDALIGHQKAKEIVLAITAEVKALADYLHLSWLRYYEGQTDYLTVLDAERRLFSAELQLTSAKGNQFTTLVNLYKSLGGAWVLDADKTATKAIDEENKALGPCYP